MSRRTRRIPAAVQSVKGLIVAKPAVVADRAHVSMRFPGGETSLWYEPIGFELSRPPTDDWVLVALVFFAMERGYDLHVEGLASPSQLAHLEDFQEAWALYRPDSFRTVRITVDEVAEPKNASADGAVAAFSGGVDSSYMVAAHRDGILGHRTRHIEMAVLLHGFDIPLSRQDGFSVAHVRAKRALDPFGIPLLAVRSNWRELTDRWVLTHPAGLASVLHLFASRVGLGLLAADVKYRDYVQDWGSNPVTNRFLGSNSFPLETTGFGATRSEKCQVIGRHASLTENIRVCWEGPEPGSNCGRCEKCVRTKLSFEIAGVEPFPGLGTWSRGDLRRLHLREPLYLPAIRDMYEDSDDPKLRGQLSWLLRRERSRLWVQAQRQRLKRR